MPPDEAIANGMVSTCIVRESLIARVERMGGDCPSNGIVPAGKTGPASVIGRDGHIFPGSMIGADVHQYHAYRASKTDPDETVLVGLAYHPLDHTAPSSKTGRDCLGCVRSAQYSSRGNRLG